MPNIGENIRRIRNLKGMSQLNLAIEAGVDPSMVSRAENGQMTLIPASLPRIALALGVSVAQLLEEEPNISLARLGKRRVPILDNIQAGAWTGVVSELRDEDIQEFILTEVEHSGRAFAMRIRGDSMQPEFKEGDAIVVDPEVNPHPGDYVVAADASGEATFKQFRNCGLNREGRDVFELLPLNHLYPSIRSDRAEIHIVGTMIEHRRYRKHYANVPVASAGRSR